MKYLYILVTVFLLIGAETVLSECMQDSTGAMYCGKGECAINTIGKVLCSKYKNGGVAINSIGSVVCGKGKCKVNNIGTVYCSKFIDGGAAVNDIGGVECGIGECVTDTMGTVYCSKIPGGGASLNNIGTAVCDGGCVRGGSSNCENRRQEHCESNIAE